MKAPLRRVLSCTGLQTQTRLLSALLQRGNGICIDRGFVSECTENGSSDGEHFKVSEARVAFKSPSGVSRTTKSANMAKDLGVEVKEVDSGVQGQKVLNFKGKGQGPAGQKKAAVESNARDVFKASHERQAELGTDIDRTDSLAHSAQNKCMDGAHPGAGAQFPQKPQAHGERLSEDKYRDTESVIQKAAKQPAQPCSVEEEEQTVSRYQAMKAAAGAALNRASGMYASNQATAQEYGRAATTAAESAYKKGKEALDKGLQAMKNLAGTAEEPQDVGLNSKEFPSTVPASTSDAEGRLMRPEAGSTQDAEGTWDAGSTTFKVHPGGKGATQEISEVAAHKGERDAASY